MRSTLGRGIVTAALVVAALSVPPERARAGSAIPSCVPGRIVVRFRADSAALRAFHPESGRASLAGRPAFPLGVAPRHVDLSSAAERLSRTVRIEVDPHADVAQAVAEWAGRADVEFAAPVHLIPVESDNLPSDPDLASQWFHDAIGSRQAWQITTGDSSVVVGIIDTGVDYTHPDLRRNLWINAAEARGLPGVDDDGNGYVDDIIGYDFTDVPEIDGAGDFTGRDPDPMDEVGHGTWVAGVVCATANNGIGGAGVAFGARFMPLRAGFRPRAGFSLGFLAEDDAAAAVVYGVDNGAQILNLSFGDQLRAPILEDAVRYAVDRGVVVVAAAGNSGDDLPFYPASLTGVLAVGASDRNGVRAGYSTWGPAVDLLAPGNGIYTTDIGSGYASRSGTSLAAPVASGAAALLKSLHPDWPASQVIGVMLQSARPAAPGADAHGAGLLDVGAAVHDQAVASLSIAGLDQGSSFDSEIVVAGTVQGAGVRGWQVLARRSAGEPWVRLAAEVRGTAVQDTLATWNVADLPEGPALLRVEALGWDGPIDSREFQVSIDHSPPRISDLEVFPIRTGAAVGIRLTAKSDEDVLGTLNVRGSPGDFQFRSILMTRDVVLGLDGPLLSSTGGMVQGSASFVNSAGLVTTRDFTLQLPEFSETTNFRRHPAPGLRTLIPALTDLDRDGRPEVVGEMPAQDGSTYGAVAAWSATGEPCDTCAWNFTPVWQSPAHFLPRDVADFDGDGAPEILGLALQEIRVYTHSAARPFPDSLGWSSSDAWPVRFIPAPEGHGFDIVASRDTEIRIYRRDGSGLALRQAIPNPTAGENAVSPDIVVVRGSSGTGLLLATIDSDRDLFVVARASDGLFHSQWSHRLDQDFLGELASGDLDGDGQDELITVEAIGAMPSPAAGLRDGFYRIQVFHDDDEGGYSISPQMSFAVAGQFPGNPVSLQTSDLNGDGRAAMWLGLHDHLYLVRWDQGTPKFPGEWDGVEPGVPASGALTPAPSERKVAIFPGASGTSSSGTLLEISPTAVPVALRLAVDHAGYLGGKIELKLAWNDAAPPYHLSRYRAGAAEPAEPEFEIAGLASPTFRDTALAPGISYVYRVQSAAGGPIGSLALKTHVGNRIISAAVETGGIGVEWESPLRVTESASVTANGIAVSSTGLDRTGRRLFIRTARPIPPGPHQLIFRGFECDPEFSLGPPDSAVTVFLTDAHPLLSLRSVQVIDRNHLRLAFDAGAPIDAGPADFHFAPDLRVEEAIPAAATELELVLDPATPLKPGRYQVRLSAGLRNKFGAAVQTGSGDALSFSVTPVVFPNPVRADQASVQFQWLLQGARVGIYDLQGRSIWSGVAGDDGLLTWNVTDGAGKRVAPGVYLFQVEGVVATSGKLAVIR